jgi:hypothetical protein
MNNKEWKDLETQIQTQIWENAQKKDKATGRTPREKLDLPTTNTQQLKETYSSALQLAERYGKQQRQILKINYEAGLVERGEYISQDLALIIEGENKRRDILEGEATARLNEFKRIQDALKAEETRLKGSKLKGAAEERKNVS